MFKNVFLSLVYFLLALQVHGQITQAEIQAKVNNASDGSTIEIPNGNYTWTGELIINKFIHLKGQSREGVRILNNNTSSNLIDVTESKAGSIELSNLEIDSPQSNIYVFSLRTLPSQGAKPILLHDCVFKTGYRYAVNWATNGGVIWDCFFDGTKSNGLSGISFVAPSLPGDWTKPSTLGVLDKDGRANTYVEDCVFDKTTIGCMNFDDNSRVVIRYCTFDNSQIGSHGQETSVAGARQWELYNNQFICNPENAYNINTYFQVRGGTGVITDNDFQNIPWGKTKIQLCVFNIRRRGQVPCQTQYPAARQVGQGWIGEGGHSYPSVPQNGSGYMTDPIAIWNNTGAGARESNFVELADYQPDECGNGMRIADFVKLDRDYMMRAKAGYQKYPYPHPLRSGVNPPPAATPEPSAAPSVTPPVLPPESIPEPTPNPNAPTFRQWLDRLSDWIKQHPSIPD